MKTTILFWIFAALALDAQTVAPLLRMMDQNRNIAQRNDACYELRGADSREALAAFQRALADPGLRSCAARNLRQAAAVEELKNALSDSDPEIRGLAARELGFLSRPELLEALSEAAHDSNLLVAVNAFGALAQYKDTAVLPNLLDLAAGGGLVGAMALSRAVAFQDPAVLSVARRLMATRDVPLRLGALPAIADLGDRSDLPGLRELAKKAETAAPAGRGL